MTGGAVSLKLEWLMALHCDEGLHLVTADHAGFVYLVEENAAELATGATDGAARAYVTELIRLARIGQRVEASASSPDSAGGISGGEPS
jgi:hypothetical protein